MVLLIIKFDGGILTFFSALNGIQKTKELVESLNVFSQFKRQIIILLLLQIRFFIIIHDFSVNFSRRNLPQNQILFLRQNSLYTRIWWSKILKKYSD